MKHWFISFLSYAGCLQLIMTVITITTAYWLQLFPISKKVMKHIESMCRSFLWSGSEVPTKKAHVAWEKVCDPRMQVG